MLVLWKKIGNELNNFSNMHENSVSLLFDGKIRRE